MSATESWPSKLQANLPCLNDEEVQLVKLLLTLNQDHLFSDWDDAGVNDDLKHKFFQQVKMLHCSYPIDGGLAAYISRSRLLLADSKSGENPFEGWRPEIPSGSILNPLTENYSELETLGLSQVGLCGFILVAGGLGERLGYSGIKVELPTQTTTNICYLELYCKQILAIQSRYGSDGHMVPLAIMVSDDTITKTEDLLHRNNNFGLHKDQITLIKQEKVAALSDNDARISQIGPYEIDAKPHGHGDVHALMHSSGLAKCWYASGVRWITFFQDTNALAHHLLPAMIGVSLQSELEVNSLAIPRFAKQAVGAIARLVHEDGRVMTINVEYNQLDPLLRSTISPEGDVNDPKTGQSIFPGNINQLLFRLEPYIDVLQRTSGVMGEFVNPKYSDSSRTKFKKPTRLECMMQDYPKVLGSEAKVGFSQAPAWICYSPVKNNAADAAASVAAGVPAGSAIAGESDQYFAPAECLRILGAHIQQETAKTYLGLSGSLGPRIVFDPSFAVFPGEIASRFPSPTLVSISAKSTLVISGDVIIHSLNLDGSLRLEAAPGSRLIVQAGDVLIKNEGHVVEPAGPSTEVIEMRGYVIKCVEEAVYAVQDAGEFIFTGESVQRV
eukprot:gene755-1440_t